MRPAACPYEFPFRFHRTMAEVLEVEERIGAQRAKEREYHRAYRARRRA